MKIRNIYIALATSLAALGVGQMASAQSRIQVAISEPGQTPVSQNLSLPLNKSSVVELSVPAADVIVTNPAIADAIVRTSQRIIFRGVDVGETNAFFFDAYGNQLLDLQIKVEQNLDFSDLNGIYSRILPTANIQTEVSNGSVILSGRVDNLSDAMTAVELAENFMAPEGQSSNDVSNVINLLSIDSKDQVLLKVRIVEMQRTLTKQLGVNLTNTQTFAENDGTVDGTATTSTSNAFNVAGRALGGLAAGVSYQNFVGEALQSSVGLNLQALERIGLIRTLAEPNLTAISGESATFLAGGEFPVPVGSNDEGQIELEFKPFGVGLSFTPVVLSEGRISLEISTEVSDITQQGAFAPQSVVGTNDDGEVITVQSVSIPGLTVRRAETTVELPSGGSTVIAGLIQENTRQSLDAIPGIKNIPILGALFRSRDFQNDETELVIMVTPYLVDPVDPNKLRTPDEGLSSAGDLATIFLGRLNDLYAVPGANTKGETFNAPVGFIIE